MMRGILILGLLVGMVGTAGAEALSGGGGSGGVTPTTEEAIWTDTPLAYDRRDMPVVIVDKKVLTELLAEAQREGASLNVAVYEYDDKREVWVRARPDPCLETMQAAMEAMEPYILKGMTIREHEPDFKSKVWKAWEIYKQWAEAKACWRKPYGSRSTPL
jgi:hypothetical protein